MSSDGVADLGVLLGQAAQGDVYAAGTVYDATIDDAWRIAVATIGSRDQAAAALAAAYARVWAEAGAAPVRGDAPCPRVLTRGWVLAWVYRASRDLAGPVA